MAHRLCCSAASGTFPDQEMSPALAGRFFTTEPPRKPLRVVFFSFFLFVNGKLGSLHLRHTGYGLLKLYAVLSDSVFPVV